MESRNVTLTLEKAREWYNSGSADLKEVALQAYTKDELTIPEWQNIKTFKDAVKALGMNLDNVICDISHMEAVEGKLGKHLIAIYKLDIIHKALNKDWNPSLVEGGVYYPFVKFYTAGQKAREAAASNGWELGPTFMADNKKYTLVGGDSYCNYCVGLANFGYGYGDVLPSVSLLGCKSREIAEYMSRHFSKEIFEATYTQHTGTYRWV